MVKFKPHLLQLLARSVMVKVQATFAPAVSEKSEGQPVVKCMHWEGTTENPIRGLGLTLLESEYILERKQGY